MGSLELMITGLVAILPLQEMPGGPLNEALVLLVNDPDHEAVLQTCEEDFTDCRDAGPLEGSFLIEVNGEKLPYWSLEIDQKKMEGLIRMRNLGSGDYGILNSDLLESVGEGEDSMLVATVRLTSGDLFAADGCRRYVFRRPGDGFQFGPARELAEHVLFETPLPAASEVKLVSDDGRELTLKPARAGDDAYVVIANRPTDAEWKFHQQYQNRLPHAAHLYALAVRTDGSAIPFTADGCRFTRRPETLDAVCISCPGGGPIKCPPALFEPLSMPH